MQGLLRCSVSSHRSLRLSITVINCNVLLNFITYTTFTFTACYHTSTIPLYLLCIEIKFMISIHVAVNCEMWWWAAPFKSPSLTTFLKIEVIIPFRSDIASHCVNPDTTKNRSLTVEKNNCLSLNIHSWTSVTKLQQLHCTVGFTYTDLWYIENSYRLGLLGPGRGQ